MFKSPVLPCRHVNWSFPPVSAITRTAQTTARLTTAGVRKFGFTRKLIQRYQCKTCCTTFTEFKGTVLHGRHHSLDTIVECLKLLAERNSLAAIHARQRD